MCVYRRLIADLSYREKIGSITANYLDKKKAELEVIK